MLIHMIIFVIFSSFYPIFYMSIYYSILLYLLIFNFNALNDDNNFIINHPFITKFFMLERAGVLIFLLMIFQIMIAYMYKDSKGENIGCW